MLAREPNTNGGQLIATPGSTTAAIRPKEYHFPLSVEWIGERRVAARAPGKSAIEIMPPPVFRGIDPTVWSPEDFFVAAAASCLAITFTGLAARAGLTYTKLKVDADGLAGMRTDGRFGFTRLLLRLEVETDQAEEARELAERAEETCLVSASLDLPVDTEIKVGPGRASGCITQAVPTAPDGRGSSPSPAGSSSG